MFFSSFPNVPFMRTPFSLVTSAKEEKYFVLLLSSPVINESIFMSLGSSAI